MTTEHMGQQAAAVVMAETAVDREDAEITSLVMSAEALTITTADELRASNALLITIKGRQKNLSELRFSITKPLDEAKKRVMGVFQPAVDRLASAERTIAASARSVTLPTSRS